MRHLVFVLLMLSLPAAADPLGPSNPPPGITAEAWKGMTGRAAWVSKSVKAIAPKADSGCVYAVVLELLGGIHASYSQDKPEFREGPRDVAKGKVKAFKSALKQNSEDECGGGSGGAGIADTVRGLLQFAAQQEEWDVANYGELKGSVARAAEAIVKMGIFVPAGATEGATLLRTGIALPVLDPSLFMPKTSGPNDGT
jgi:hypothetical protein